MATKRLMLDVEQEEEGGACGLENGNLDSNGVEVENHAKRRKPAMQETPLQRMLKRHIPDGVILSPITELSQNMQGTRLDGTPKSTQRSQSSRTLNTFNSLSSRTLSGFSSSCSSYDSGNSLDDEYMSMFELESVEDHNLELPDDLEVLLSGQLKSEDNPESESFNKTRSLRRCLSLFPSDQPEDDDHSDRDTNMPIKKLQRKTLSMNDAEIMSALGDEPQLIGDLSKPCALPCLVTGIRHRDLKTISCETLARLIQGEYDQQLGSQGGYEIIDCRYPYEFLGGHIQGAKNLYTRGQIQEAFPNLTSNQEERRIYVFHCEFSSERGPKLLRFLRSNDRNQHANNYPALDYPELYILHNGYKEFYGHYAHLCEPKQYVPMLAPAHNDEFRYFRAKTKSWQCGEGGDSGIGGGGSRGLRKSRSRLLYAE
ncbi:cdc25-like protein phosphatase twine [Drosophila eugracilis]|uniref:cdc25-like protein phosphatase twine n=1 Tax=Drosophila eugracilis TaxID=29029 RepID=UPI0007E8627A|nr:cdc25-like protein phosphatase twine [Drosophila eugracilis]XP_017073051.1 cdc25-like protein phosphatase twine [Drosophila eugracilis]XP_017073822.1 cdc25-like protein phosphatase twine [Drosophila eugracilis]